MSEGQEDSMARMLADLLLEIAAEEGVPPRSVLTYATRRMAARGGPRCPEVRAAFDALHPCGGAVIIPFPRGAKATGGAT